MKMGTILVFIGGYIFILGFCISVFDQLTRKELPLTPMIGRYVFFSWQPQIEIKSFQDYFRLPICPKSKKLGEASICRTEDGKIRITAETQVEPTP